MDAPRFARRRPAPDQQRCRRHELGADGTRLAVARVRRGENRRERNPRSSGARGRENQAARRQGIRAFSGHVPDHRRGKAARRRRRDGRRGFRRDGGDDRRRARGRVVRSRERPQNVSAARRFVRQLDALHARRRPDDGRRRGRARREADLRARRRRNFRSADFSRNAPAKRPRNRNFRRLCAGTLRL